MSLIDIPLTTGMRQDTAQNIGGDGLWQATDVWMPQPGKLQVRGGFQGAAGDVIATAVNVAGRSGLVRHMAEVSGGMVLLGDNYLCRYEQPSDRYGYIQQLGGITCPASCLMSHELVPVVFTNVGATAVRGTTVRLSSGITDPVRTVAATDGKVFLRTDSLAGVSGWTVEATGVNDSTCCALGNQTGAPRVVYATWNYDITTSAGVIGDLPATVTPVTSIAGICIGAVNHRSTSDGGAIVVYCNNTSVRIYYVTTAGATLKVTYNHGVASVLSGRIAVSAANKLLYVALDSATGYPTTGTVKSFRFDIPTDPTSAWTATPAATFSRAYTGRLLEHDIIEDGSAVLCIKDTGWTATTAYKVEAFIYNAEATTVTNWPGYLNLDAVTATPQFVLRSKIFSVRGCEGRFAFASVNAGIGEPSNALLIVSLPLKTAGTVGFGVCSTSYVQQESTVGAGTLLLQPVSDGVWYPTLSTDGSIQFLHSIVVGNDGTTNGNICQVALSRYDFAPQSNVLGAVNANPMASRSVCTDGQHVVASGITREMVGYLGTPGYSACYITALGKTAVGNACVAGTYQVKVLIEVDTPVGKWRGPPSLPVSIALAAGDRIDVGVIAAPMGWSASWVTWRVLVYVAPPGSSVYYMQSSYQGYKPSTFCIQQLQVSIPTLDGGGATLNTASEIIYDTTEPPRTYPGDAYGVAFAGNRFWRFRENSAWFTHAAQGTTVRQWCGDVFRVDFAGRVQGIGQSLGQPVVITDGAVYQLSGPGPDRNGNGSFEVRQINADPLGCLDQRSVCNIIPGLCWASNRGIELLPNGSSDIQLISEPVRELIWDTATLLPPHQFTLGAHNQPRSTVIWASGSRGVIVWDYLHNAWFKWDLLYPYAVGSIGGSFVLATYDSTNARMVLQWDAKALGSWSYYPMYTTDKQVNGDDRLIAGIVQTKPLRLSGINKAGSWRGVWITAGTGDGNSTNTITVYQTADGSVQTSVTLTPEGGAAGSIEVANWRSMHLFPVNSCDSSSVTLYLNQQANAARVQPMFLSALTVEYDATGAPSLLGSSVRS